MLIEPKTRLPKRPKGTPVGRKPLITAASMEQNVNTHQIRPVRSVGFTHLHRWQIAALRPQQATKKQKAQSKAELLAALNNKAPTGAAQTASTSKTMVKMMETQRTLPTRHALKPHPSALSPSLTDMNHTHLHPEEGCIHCTKILRLTHSVNQMWTDRTKSHPHLAPHLRQQHPQQHTQHQPPAPRPPWQDTDRFLRNRVANWMRAGRQSVSVTGCAYNQIAHFTPLFGSCNWNLSHSRSRSRILGRCSRLGSHSSSRSSSRTVSHRLGRESGS